jgi:hypothetical protein
MGGLWRGGLKLSIVGTVGAWMAVMCGRESMWSSIDVSM